MWSRSLIVIAGSLLTAGCATAEHRYSAKFLPAELQASAWRAPCTIDLSQTAAGGRPAKFDCGDEVEVVLSTGLNVSEITRIRTIIADDGTVELPSVGRISVAGTTAEAVRQAVIQACHRENASETPVVQISLQQPRQHRITVSGAVEHPGIYTLPRQSSDLVSALAAAGGLCRDAGARITIQSRGAGKDDARPAELRGAGAAPSTPVPAVLTERIDGTSDRREIELTSMSAEHLTRQDLKDGDIVVVERRGPPGIVVTGMVQKPGRYELPIGEEYRVLDAVATAQGVSHKVIDTIVVCRVNLGQPERAKIQVSLREASRNESENIVLMPGDIVSVETNAGMLVQDVAKYVGLATVASLGVFIHF